MGATVFFATMRTNGLFLEHVLRLGTQRGPSTRPSSPPAKSRKQEKRHELRLHPHHHC
jgi:hypothetical protein